MEHAHRQTVETGAQDGLLVHYLGSISPAAGGCVVEFSFTLPAVPPDTRTAVAITLLVMGFNLIGDALQEVTQHGR